MIEFTDKIKEVFSRQVKKEKEVVGNITHFYCDEILILIFEDGRWASFDYDSRCSETGIYFDTDGPELWKLEKAGLLSKEAVEEQRRRYEIWRDKRQEEREREMYERLKKKFEAVS